VLFHLEEAGSAGPWSEWKRDWPARKRKLQSTEPKSLFNTAILRKLIAAS